MEAGAAQAGRVGKATGGHPRALGLGARPLPLPCVFSSSAFTAIFQAIIYQASTD